MPVYSELVKPHLEYSIQFGSLQFTRCVEKLVRVNGRATAVVGGLEHISCEEWLKELGLFSQMRSTPMENVIAACKYLKGS